MEDSTKGSRIGYKQESKLCRLTGIRPQKSKGTKESSRTLLKKSRTLMGIIHPHLSRPGDGQEAEVAEAAQEVEGPRLPC